LPCMAGMTIGVPRSAPPAKTRFWGVLAVSGEERGLFAVDGKQGKWAKMGWAEAGRL
jgi:hypothetical protein